jgi:integrase
MLDLNFSYYFRKDRGEYYGSITGKGIKRKAVPLETDDENKAKKWVKAKEKENREGKVKATTETGSQSLYAYFEKQIALKGKRKSASTKNYKSSALTHLKDTPLGKKAIALIETADIADWLNGLREERSYNTKSFAFTVVRWILNRAIRDKIIDRNPCFQMGTEVPKTAKDRLKEARKKSKLEGYNILTVEEQEQFFAEMARIEKDPKKVALYWTLAKTGLRYSEGAAMPIGAITWTGGDNGWGEIEVLQNISDNQLDVTKSEKIRFVPLTKDVHELLRQMVGPRTDTTAFVFANRNGTFFNYDQLLRKTWNPVETRMGWNRRVTPHFLRHTFTARLLKARKSIKYVSGLLGHHDVAFTMTHYGHLMPNDDQNRTDDVMNVGLPMPKLTLELVAKKATAA